MSNFSNNAPGTTVTTEFKKHHVYEVASSIADSKHIAEDYANAHRYQHRATLTIMGYPELRPYDPIYLDGLPNGLSGYWTVLSVRHVFGGRVADYILEIEVGTDFLGDTNKDAATTAANRDIQSDLAGQSLVAAVPALSQYIVSPNSSSLTADTSSVSQTSTNEVSNIAIPSIEDITPYLDIAPNTDFLKNKVQWTSTTAGKVVQ
jgi:hypothetical protein